MSPAPPGFFMRNLLAVLHQLPETPQANAHELLMQLVDAIRPGWKQPPSQAAVSLRKLLELLQNQPVFRERLGQHVAVVFSRASFTRLFAEAGLLPSDGFFSEAFRRVRHGWLPEVPDVTQMDDVLSIIFRKPTDFIWVKAVPSSLWLEIWLLLRGEHLQVSRKQLEHAMITLTHRLAALGNEDDIIRRTPLNLSSEPIFLEQAQCLFQVMEGDEHALKRLSEVLDACDKVVQIIIKDTHHLGVGLSLSYRLRRIQQHIQRIRFLLLIWQPGQQEQEPGFPFFLELLEGVNTKNRLRDHIQQNIGLLAFQVVEHAGETGAHYITKGKKEYFSFLWASMKGGIIVGFLAMFKALLSGLKVAPLIQATVYSLNYALGFIFIHVTHSALATKQPAMTASAIAAAIDRQRKVAIGENEALVQLLTRVFRSQFISFVGNLLLCFPVGMGLAALYFWITGEHLATEAKAYRLMMDHHPTETGALIFAAITGCYLYVSGLISGYFDNLMVFRNIPERIEKMPFMVRWFSLKKRHAIGRYLKTNMGSLAGNFFLGFFLGCTLIFGNFLGIPVDIRHITFSAASFGIGLFDSGFILSWQEILTLVAGILGIGFMNFTFSFGLALITALRSRNIPNGALSQIFKGSLRAFVRRPISFFFPVETAAKKKSSTSSEPS